MQMLARRVDERPGSMHEVAEALELTLNATLALDLTELADLSAAPTESARADDRRPLAPPDPLDAVAAAAESVALAAPARAEVAPQGAAAEPQPEVRNVAHDPPQIAMSSNPYLDEVPALRAMPLSEPWERPGRYSARRPRRHRGRFLTFGLICAVGGAAVTLWGSGPLSGDNLPKALSTVVAQLQGRPSDGIAQVGAVGPTVPPSPPSPATLPDSSSAPSSSGSLGSPGAPSSGSATVRGVRIERRLSTLAARGAATWDAGDFAAAKQQVLEARTAEQTRRSVAARRHWLAAAALLKRMRKQVPRAVTAQVTAGEAALAAGRQRRAARAFALAMRIDGGGRKSAAGRGGAHALGAVLSLLSQGRRAEQAGDYSRAAYYFRRVVARAPHDGRARAALTRAAQFPQRGLPQGGPRGAGGHCRRALVPRAGGLPAGAGVPAAGHRGGHRARQSGPGVVQANSRVGACRCAADGIGLARSAWVRGTWSQGMGRWRDRPQQS